MLRAAYVAVQGVSAEILVPTLPGADPVEVLKRHFVALGATQAPSLLPSVENRTLPRVGVMLSDTTLLGTGLEVSLRSALKRISGQGCSPVLILPRTDLMVMPAWREEVIDLIADALDGFLGLGGADIDPRLYGELHRHCGPTDLDRDRFEADLALACMQRPMFMLGICRAHQLWNVAAGGALVQDLQAEEHTRFERSQTKLGLGIDEAFVLRGRHGKLLCENRVQVLRPSHLADAVRVSSFVTNAHHHQAVIRPGAGFRVTGIAPGANQEQTLIAATERWNVLTVQFHPEVRPEASADARLLDFFGDRVRAMHRDAQSSERYVVSSMPRRAIASRTRALHNASRSLSHA